MAKKSSAKAKEEKLTMSKGEKDLLAKYADRMETAVRFGYYSGIPQTDMLTLHAIYKRWVNPQHTPNSWCGNCNMTVLKGLYQFNQKQVE